MDAIPVVRNLIGEVLDPLHPPRRSPEFMALAEEVANRPPSTEPFDEWATRLAANLAAFNDHP